MKFNLKFSLFIFSALFFALQSSSSFAQNDNEKRHGTGFVDVKGNCYGYNDNAPDHDNDGIPNGLDPDYTNPKASSRNGYSKGFIDENGDGINDRANDSDSDGIPNCKDDDYVRPGDGTGSKLGFLKRYVLQWRWSWSWSM